MLDTATIRPQFPILETSVHGKPLIYLDNAATTQKPLAVLDATRNYYETQNANVHRGSHYLSQLATEAHEESRETVARFMGREPAEYIVYPDHHAYTPEDAAKLEGLGMSVICTSKDAVKLRELRLADAWALRVEAAFGPALWTEAAFPHWLDAWAKRKGLF